jgi:hypothetical protein
VQLLRGAGLEATKQHLATDGSTDAAQALTYLRECEATGDFDGFSVAEPRRAYVRYYAG